MKKTKNGYEFLDADDSSCLIEKSWATKHDEDIVWLGGVGGPKARFTQSQIAELLPMLMRFALTGDLVDRDLAIIVFGIPSDGSAPHIFSVLGDFTIDQLKEIEQAFITGDLEYPEDATGVVCEVWEAEDPEIDGVRVNPPYWEFEVLGHEFRARVVQLAWEDETDV
jgi:hypothetical protein